MELMFTILTILSYVLVACVVALSAFTWRSGARVKGSVLLLVGAALWGAYEYNRPAGVFEPITKTEVRRIDRDGLGPLPSTDIQFVYTASSSYQNIDSIWWLKKNSDNVFRDAAAVEGSGEPMWTVYTGVRSTPLSWWGNIIGNGTSFPPFTVGRIAIFYLIAFALWVAYFFVGQRISRRQG